jgi:hypothetical protein
MASGRLAVRAIAIAPDEASARFSSNMLTLSPLPASFKSAAARRAASGVAIVTVAQLAFSPLVFILWRICVLTICFPAPTQHAADDRWIRTLDAS